MEKHLLSKHAGSAFDSFTGKLSIVLFAILFCLANNMLAAIRPMPGLNKNYHRPINAKRKVPAVSTLANLVLSSGSLNPNFATATTSYAASVPNAISSITIIPTATDPTATVTVNGQTTTSGAASASIPLSVNDNTITIVVTAPGGTSTTIYTITVTRALSTNANLANLALSAGSLKPSFTSGNSNYFVSVSNSDSTITVTPTTADSTATVSVNFANTKSGTASASIPLYEGFNYIPILVTAQDGTTQNIYFLYITRAFSTNTTLASISLNNGSLTPSFTGSTTTYSTSVSNSVTSTTVTATAADPEATVQVVSAIFGITGYTSANIPLLAGTNPVIITVTAGDGATTKKYTLNITRSASSQLTGVITASTVSGAISSCAGTASNSPNILQFSVAGNYLTGDITAMAPTNFEISLNPVSGYGNSVTLKQTGGLVNNTVIYVRSAAGAPVGGISGNVTLTTSGVTTQNVAVTGVIHIIPAINAVSNKTVNNAATVPAINFTGTGGFNWINDTPGIGLAASGSGDIPAFTAINKGSTTIKATVTVAPVPTGYAYIANAGSNTVSVINTSTNLVVATIPVGTNPTGVVISPDGSKVYVVNGGEGSITVINTATNTVGATISGIDGPGQAVISPDGSTLYVTSFVNDGNLVEGYITVIKTNTNVIWDLFPVGRALAGLAISADGGQLYTTDVFASDVYVVSTVTDHYIATIPLNNNIGVVPFKILLSTDGGIAYVVNSGNIAVIDIASQLIITTIPISGDIALSPDGSKLYIASGSKGISVINTANYLLMYTIPTVAYSNGMSLSADGSRLYVINNTGVSGPGSVSVINTATNAVVATTDVGNSPQSFGSFVSAPGAGCPGTPVTFTITVNPTVLGIATLTNLKLSSGTLSPVFAGTTTTYTASVSNLTTSIKVTATASERSVTVNGVTVLSGSPSAAIPLAVGPNIITVAVTKLGVTTSYTITVTRQLSDYALLTNLRTSSGTLSPGFITSSFSYKEGVSRITSAITVTPTAGNAFETIKVNGMAVLSGTPSLPIALSDGINNITIAVTAQNGNTKNYTLAVTKPAGAVNIASQAVSLNDNNNDAHLALNSIKVSQGISPNGDGINDFLVIDGIADYPENKLTIIDRTGALVFEAKNYNNLSKIFDGHSNKNGKMQLPGTYFYSFEYKDGDTIKQQTGYIIIKY